MKIGGNNSIELFGRPCVIENEKHLLTVGIKVKETTTKPDTLYIENNFRQTKYNMNRFL